MNLNGLGNNHHASLDMHNPHQNQSQANQWNQANQNSMMSGHAMMGNAGGNHALGNMGSHGGHPQSTTPVDMATTYSQLGGMMQGGALDMSGLNQSGLVA